jgi:hypothetical protein
LNEKKIIILKFNFLYLKSEKFRTTILKSGYNIGRKYDLLMKSFKNCSEVSLELNSNDICVKNTDCYQKQIVPMRSGKVEFLKKIDCKCNKKQYVCLNNYCALNKQTCINFAKYFMNQSSDLKKCSPKKNEIVGKKVYSIF